MLLHCCVTTQRRRFARVIVAHQLHHVLLQLGLGVRVLLAQLLQDELLGERPRDAEPQELLEDERFVLCCTHSPLVQVGSLRVLELREKIQNIKYLSSSGNTIQTFRMYPRW